MNHFNINKTGKMNVGWIKIARHRYVRHTNIIKNEAKVVKPLMKRFDIVLIKLQLNYRVKIIYRY